MSAGSAQRWLQAQAAQVAEEAARSAGASPLQGPGGAAPARSPTPPPRAALGGAFDRAAAAANTAAMSEAVIAAAAARRGGNERLYEAYNDLHGLAHDFKKPFDAPAILVVGHQTDGKSALVEALMGFQFNHVGGGTKTRRPITLHMQVRAPRSARAPCHSAADARGGVTGRIERPPPNHAAAAPRRAGRYEPNEPCFLNSRLLARGLGVPCCWQACRRRACRRCSLGLSWPSMLGIWP